MPPSVDAGRVVDFHEMGLDERIVKAIAHLGWKEPTAIQEQAIPFALQGKDVLAKARTGSGKTAGFAIPAIQKILNAKARGVKRDTTVLVLAPSKELCKQICRHFEALTQCCAGLVQVTDVAEHVQLSILRPQLLERPDVVVGTPSRILAHLKAGNLDLQALQILIVDEADLVFTFGQDKDTENLLKLLPPIYQAIVSSATLTEDVLSLKRLVLHNPVTLRLDESSLTDNEGLTQYVVKCEELDKYAILAALFQLKLIKGKTLIFLNSVDKGYRTKLFLDQFAVKSCVLNSELPLSSRQMVIDRFNEGRYEVIVVTDDSNLEIQTQNLKRKKGAKRKQSDTEFAASRGLDFQFVSNVINLEFPPSVEAYVHRVGRTARANNKGTALNFVSLREMPLFKQVESRMIAEKTNMFKPYRFKIDEIEGFKYRAQTALNSLQKKVIRDARLKDVKEEMLRSEKLKTFFENNPREHTLLRHDRALRSKGAKHTSLKHVPEYIVPPTLQRIMQVSGKKRKHVEEADEPEVRPLTKKFRAKRKRNHNDPLKAFSFKSK